MANVLGTLFGEIANAIREKSGESGTMKPAEFPAKITAIPTGGGSAAGAVTVTFCNYDGMELFSRQVFIGDDCPDPISQNKIPTPTRESDAQYHYTYNGWSLTADGTASTSALKNITTDKTVYAAYSGAVRYYTITYYDSDGTTVLKTANLAYGSNANYTPEKNGYSFVGWTPEVVTVTGDASYTSSWVEKITFEGGSWADIAEICDNGEAANYFKVGDTKTVQDGDTTYVFHIIGVDVDNKADGSGKAGITVAVTGLNKSLLHQMGISASEAYDYWYYSYTMVGGGTNVLQSPIRIWLHDTFYPSLPANLQSVIKPVSKKTRRASSSSTYNAKSSTDRVFIPSWGEAFSGASEEGDLEYPYFDDSSNRVFYNTDGNSTVWWLRDIKYDMAAQQITTSGGATTVTDARVDAGVLPCFCI